MLHGLMELERFAVFAYKNNVFKYKALAMIKPILQRPDPMNLVELRLVNCGTSRGVVMNLVEFMLAEKVHLRALSLVKMKVFKPALQVIAQMIDESEHLEDVDLSWNDLLPSDFACLFPVLARNTTLRYLNLSCNMIINKKEQNNPYKFQ